MTRRCSVCRKRKDEADFYRQTRTKQYLRSECKQCSKNASRRYYQRNRTRVLATARKRYERKKKLAG